MTETNQVIDLKDIKAFRWQCQNPVCQTIFEWKVGNPVTNVMTLNKDTCRICDQNTSSGSNELKDEVGKLRTVIQELVKQKCIQFVVRSGPE